MRVAIDTQSLWPPLTGIGHFVLRLTNAMLPLLASNEELLSFSDWGIRAAGSEISRSRRNGFRTVNVDFAARR